MQQSSGESRREIENACLSPVVPALSRDPYRGIDLRRAGRDIRRQHLPGGMGPGLRRDDGGVSGALCITQRRAPFPQLSIVASNSSLDRSTNNLATETQGDTDVRTGR